MTNAWVLDVSVAIKWYLRDEEWLDVADAILSSFTDGSIGIVAPGFFLDEVGNILRTAVHRGRLIADQARYDFELLQRLGIPLTESVAQRRTAALDLGLMHGIAYYDALYLQVAIELSLPILMADRPFFDRIVRVFPSTTYLGNL